MHSLKLWLTDPTQTEKALQNIKTPKQCQSSASSTSSIHARVFIRKIPPNVSHVESEEKDSAESVINQYSKNSKQCNNKGKKKRKKIIEHVDSSDSLSDVGTDDTHELNDQEEDLVESFEDHQFLKKQIELVPYHATKISRKTQKRLFFLIAKLVCFSCATREISQKDKENV